jgi:hypothetical protein
MMKLDENSETQIKGLFAGAIAEAILPMFRQVAAFSEKQALETPADATAAQRAKVVAGYVQRVSMAAESQFGKALLQDNERRREFLRGFKVWQEHRPSEKWETVGNMATLPYFYLALFWREFSELRSMKEAYWALLRMFDGNVALAGSSFSFQKRAEAIGLSYRIKRPSN